MCMYPAVWELCYIACCVVHSYCSCCIDSRSSKREGGEGGFFLPSFFDALGRGTTYAHMAVYIVEHSLPCFFDFESVLVLCYLMWSGVTDSLQKWKMVMILSLLN